MKIIIEDKNGDLTSSCEGAATGDYLQALIKVTETIIENTTGRSLIQFLKEYEEFVEVQKHG